MTQQIDVSHFTPVEQTAFVTLYAKALDSKSSRPILGDHQADRTATRIDYDFDDLGVVTSVVCQSSLRAKMLDDRARRFVAANHTAVVLDLGAGLDDARSRVQPPDGVDWYNIDLPAVLAVRDTVLPDAPQNHSIPVDLTESNWAAAIPKDRPAFLRADGLFAFLDEQTIVKIFRGITDHFESGELAFNDYGRIGWVSRAAVRLAPQKMFGAVGGLYGYPGFKDAHHPQNWNPKLRLVEETSLATQPEVDLFPTPLRVSTRLAAHVPAMARKARILLYRF